MTMKKAIISALLFSALSLAVQAQSLILPDLLKGDIVLQQKTEARIWGKAKPGAEVKVQTSWDNKVYKVKAASDSLWNVKVSTLEASYTPYSIQVS